MKLYKILIGFAGLALLVGAACSAPVVLDQKGQPTNNGQASGTPGEPRKAYEGVSFILDPAVAPEINGQVIAEKSQPADGPYWDANPQYVSIALDGYPLAQTTLKPVIAVYPVEDYRRLSPPASKVLDQLKDLLAQKPADADQIPFLPVWNAAQTFHSNVQYLNFQNGSGVRFLAIYAQYPAPVNNKDLFYTYQGLTADGRYFVSVILPVNHPSLPADSNALSTAEMETIAKNYNQYRSDMAGKLAALPANSFTPDLSRLDALVTSLKIDR